MRIRSDQLFTARHPQGVLGRIVQFPVTRMVIAVAFFVPFLIPHNTVIADFIIAAPEPLGSYLSYLDAVSSAAILLLLYSLYVRTVEGRKSHEIGAKRSLGEFAAGASIALVIVGTTVALMAALGFYTVNQAGPAKILVDAFFRFGVGAFVQVLLFRLILFRLAEELLGTWLGFLATASIFGIAHLVNAGTSAGDVVALFLGDSLLCALFVYTRRLWAVWGMHMGWNFLQDGVLGMPNSGVTSLPSWIDPVVTGPAWITGGSLGIERSFVAILLSLVAASLIAKRAIDHGQIVPPSWRRGARSTPVAEVGGAGSAEPLEATVAPES